MENSRSSTPEAPPENLWSSILDSVSSSRSLPSKQILLLGQPSTGKSAIASALLQKAVPSLDENKEDHRIDFALGYEFADVRDDGDEDTLARLSVYSVPSSKSSYTALLPHFLPPRTALPHTLVMIMLDWTRPWSFVEELQMWLQWVERWVKGDGSRELEVIREECRERLQSHLQHYSEPSTDSGTLPTSNTALNNTILPLGPGTLTHNSAGVPIIVVCSKADLIDEEIDTVAAASGMGGMVKGKGGEWEERTDGVMQVLRTICLKYGASLFYTTPQPATLQVLRQHALHLLFMPPLVAPAINGGSEAPAPIRNPFPFQHKPNTLDRDRIVVPAGWDSWGKISVLREGFDAKSWGEAWEHDLEEADGQGSGEAGAKKLFAMLVPDQGERPHLLPPINNPMPEQTFLLKHYDENSKKADRDPRASFRNPTDLTTGAPTGIVGPLGSSSFSMPNVERVLNEMENSNILPPNPVNPAADPRKFPNRPPGRSAGLGALNVPTNVAPGARAPSSSNPGSSTSPTGPQPQHEVLHNFFQSLLSSRAGGRDRNAAAATSPTAKMNGQTEDTNT
ncbi:hypothetical protein D9756_000241 [Leucocoprinus leucothites]|uniref:Dynein 1 light intermediate chain n=1 Tax=Leucocoprinus leucothites TaxID=201217 RepID=A0A8H5GEB0_9AGAR|nr:hypothetical protein D9756_000241 [Leucoagaricus leucothites]